MRRLRAILMLLLLLWAVGCDRDQATPSSARDLEKRLPEVIPATTEPDSLALGEFEGELTQDDPVHVGIVHDPFYYTGRPGELLTVEMSSDEIDPYLTLQLITEEGRVAIDADDDGGPGSSARLRRELPEQGTYVISACSAERGRTGRYRLRVSTEDLPRHTAGAPPRGRLALIVSIEDYPLRRVDLEGPTRDARLFTDLLVETYDFEPADIVHLRDAEATRLRLQEAFAQHLGRARATDLVVFYFSGHGIKVPADLLAEGIPEDGLEDGSPQDGTDPSPAADPSNEALLLADGSFLLDDELGVLLDRIPSDRILCVLDCCFSGGALRGTGAGRVKRARVGDLGYELRVPPALLTSARSKGILAGSGRTLALTASLEQQVAFIVPRAPEFEAPVSIFTHFLVTALARPEGLSFAQLMQTVGAQTSTLARQSEGTDQRPTIQGPGSTVAIREFMR